MRKICSKQNIQSRLRVIPCRDLYCQGWAGQGAGQGRAGQDRAGQDRLVDHIRWLTVSYMISLC